MKNQGSNLNSYKNDKFDIIVLAGQSNAYGFGIGPVESEFVENESILFLSDNLDIHFEKDENGQDYLAIPEWQSNSIIPAKEKESENGKIGNLSLSFSDKYIKDGMLEEGRKVLIVNAAVGGTGFMKKHWGVDAVLYRRLVELTSIALGLNPENRVVAVLWHQGEHDAFESPEMDKDTRCGFYYRSLLSMFNDYTNTFGLQDVPIIAGAFCNEWYEKNKESCDAVLVALGKVLLTFDSTVVCSKGLLSNNEKIGNGDDIHFCREALYILGERYFAEYKRTLNEKLIVKM